MSLVSCLATKINGNKEGLMWLAPEVGFGHVPPELGPLLDQALEARRRPNNSGKLPTDCPSLALTKNTRAASVWTLASSVYTFDERGAGRINCFQAIEFGY